MVPMSPQPETFKKREFAQNRSSTPLHHLSQSQSCHKLDSYNFINVERDSNLPRHQTLDSTASPFRNESVS